MNERKLASLKVHTDCLLDTELDGMDCGNAHFTWELIR